MELSFLYFHDVPVYIQWTFASFGLISPSVQTLPTFTFTQVFLIKPQMMSESMLLRYRPASCYFCSFVADFQNPNFQDRFRSGRSAPSSGRGRVCESSSSKRSRSDLSFVPLFVIFEEVQAEAVAPSWETSRNTLHRRFSYIIRF